MRHYRPTYEDKVAFLKRAAAYKGHARSVQCIETHFAWVFLVGGDAYKLKKPMRHRDMDYRSLASRERGCREEVRLNRRFASQIYRGVVPLTAANGSLVLGGDGEVVDWLIRMRRLPAARMLDGALQRGGVTAAEIQRVARVLARLYRRATPRPMSGARYVERLMREIRNNRREIGRYGGRVRQSLAQEVLGAQVQALELLRPALAARGARLVDGHGDLRAEHVYLGSRIAIIDSLEFDPALRRLDPAEEVSLLAVEIERLGYRALAQRLVELFRKSMGGTPDRAVFHFYQSHRAATRAKLAAWHLADPRYRNPAQWIARTESLLEDALRYARAALCGSSRKHIQSIADGRPAVKEGRERGAGDHSTDRFGKDRGHVQLR